jgi:CRP-like cAMP-binding protein
MFSFSAVPHRRACAMHGEFAHGDCRGNVLVPCLAPGSTPRESLLTAASSAPSPNRLIAALPRSQRARLLRACEPVEMAFGEVLCEAGRPYRHAWFPHTGLISQVSTLNGHNPIEMGLIGQEGMLGATVLLGVDEVPIRAVVQVPGIAMRIPVARLRQELHDGPGLRKVLGRYLYLRLVELSLTTACTRFHNIDQRLSRLLLLTHDRARADRLHLTHEAVADMLGVRRSGVTVAAGALQADGLIAYSRGKITILDRPGLESATCECYGMFNGRRDQLQTDNPGENVMNRDQLKARVKKIRGRIKEIAGRSVGNMQLEAKGKGAGR